MRQRGRATMMVAFTIARLLLVWELVQTIPTSFGCSVAWLAAIVLADIYDGVFARRLGVDGLWRRITDASVDVVSILTVVAALLVNHPEYRSGLVLFDLGIWVFVKGLSLIPCILSLWRYRILVRGYYYHRLSSLGAMFMALALMHGVRGVIFSNWVAMFTITVSAICMVDYWWAWKIVRRSTVRTEDGIAILRTSGHPRIKVEYVLPTQT